MRKKSKSRSTDKSREKSVRKISNKRSVKKNDAIENPILSLLYPEHLSENTVIEELREKVERLKVFDALGRTLTSSLDLEEILRLVIDRFAHLVGSKRMGLIFTVPESNQYYFQYPPQSSQLHPVFSPGRGILGRAIDSGKAQLI